METRWMVDVSLIRQWLETLDNDTEAQVVAALELLSRYGPSLGRPLVDRVKNSRHHNMKELRPGSTGRSEVRILFAFDPQRKAILLLGGSKTGLWNAWYRQNIKKADLLYDQHLGNLKE